MNTRFSMLPGMAEATRLVRAGALNEAVAAIQRSLGGYASSTPGPVAREVRPDAGRFISHSYSNAAGTREYKLYTPSGYHGQPMPLVVMLHGCTQTPDDFASGTRMNELAQEHGFFVAYPAQASAANPKRCWNWFKRSEQHRGEGEPSLIAGITRKVMAEHAVASSRIYVAGLSSGGAMAAIMAATHPDLYAAAGVHSGLAYGAACDLPSALAAMRSGSAGAKAASVPTIVFHGDRDSLVHPANGEELIAQWLGDRSASAMSVETGANANGYGYTRRVLRGASGQPVLEHWLVHGAGHAWSGGSASGSHADPRGPDASREMVRFFLANPRFAEVTECVRAA